jgi:cell division protein FtsZ
MSVTCGEGQVIGVSVSSSGDDVEESWWVIKLECDSVEPQTREDSAREDSLILVFDGLDRTEDALQRGKTLLQPKANPLVKIVVVGIGSSGSNTVDKIIASGVQGITFVALNTDLQALKRAHAPTKVQLGAKLTCGLGAGSDPAVGRLAAIDSTDKIAEVLEGADMVFVTTGLGGGTGTGAAPVVASLAKELGALTVAVVTTPFSFEGQLRMRQAKEGMSLLRERADAVITLPNERLLSTLHKATSLKQAFVATDDVLRRSVQSILELVTVSGLINLDFADVRTVMTDMGSAFLGTGRASGELRALQATQQAITSPLLEGATIEGAKGLLINITGSPDLTLFEVNEASSIIREAAHEDANIIFGAVIDESLQDEMRITIIATGC